MSVSMPWVRVRRKQLESTSVDSSDRSPVFSTQSASVTPVGREGCHAAEADGTGADGTDAVGQPLHPPSRSMPAMASMPLKSAALVVSLLLSFLDANRPPSRPGSPDCRSNRTARPRRVTYRGRATIKNLPIAHKKCGSHLPRIKQSSAGRDSAGICRWSSRSALVSTKRAGTLHRRCYRPTWRGHALTSSQPRRGFHRRSTSICPHTEPGTARPAPYSPKRELGGGLESLVDLRELTATLGHHVRHHHAGIDERSMSS